MWKKPDDIVELDVIAVGKIMEYRGITRYELARLIVRDKNEVKLWLTGKRHPRWASAHMIADALDCDMEHLTGEKPFVPDPEPDPNADAATPTRGGGTGTLVEKGLLGKIKVGEHLASWSTEEKARFFAAISELLQLGIDVPLVGKPREGCVELALRLTREQWERLEQAFAAGELAHLKVTKVEPFYDLRSQSGDDLPNRLGQAHDRSSTPGPAEDLGDVAGAILSRASRAQIHNLLSESRARRAQIPNLPPELANNPQYDILRELGRGGMGVVYQARLKEMDRRVVIKVINHALLDRLESLKSYYREISAAAQLSHPNIVTLYDARQAGESHMLVMEFVPGQSLDEVLKKKGPLPISIACHFARQMALGLQYAYEHHLVHRDIKPQNLMLTPEGQVKILDFGLAKFVREENTSTGLTSENAYLGTPDYCAPEQATDVRTADIRADLYSLGCTLYYLLCGRPPFQEDTVVKTILAHQQKQPQPLTELRPEVSEELAAVVGKMMAKSPARRYQTPLEVVQALSPFVKQGSTPKASPELSAGMQEAKPAVKPAPPVAPPPERTAKEAMPTEPTEPTDA